MLILSETTSANAPFYMEWSQALRDHCGKLLSEARGNRVNLPRQRAREARERRARLDEERLYKRYKGATQRRTQATWQ